MGNAADLEVGDTAGSETWQPFEVRTTPTI
jgi:hypothetical protein